MRSAGKAVVPFANSEYRYALLSLETLLPFNFDWLFYAESLLALAYLRAVLLLLVSALF